MLYTPTEAGRMTVIAQPKQPKLLHNMQSWFFLKLYIFFIFKEVFIEESSKAAY